MFIGYRMHKFRLDGITYKGNGTLQIMGENSLLGVIELITQDKAIHILAKLYLKAYISYAQAFYPHRPLSKRQETKELIN